MKESACIHTCAAALNLNSCLVVSTVSSAQLASFLVGRSMMFYMDQWFTWFICQSLDFREFLQTNISCIFRFFKNFTYFMVRLILHNVLSCVISDIFKRSGRLCTRSADEGTKNQTVITKSIWSKHFIWESYKIILFCTLLWFPLFSSSLT